MNLLARFVRYQDYISGQLVENEIDERACENTLELARAKHLAKNWTGSSSDRVSISKAEAVMDLDVRACEERYEAQRAKRKMYFVLSESLARDAAVVSRELSRRIGRNHLEVRADKYTP